MLKALALIRARNGNRPVRYYAHPDMFRSRARKLPGGQMWPSKDVPSVEMLTLHGAQVINTRTAQTFLDGMFFLSGEIPRVTPFERGYPEGPPQTAPAPTEGGAQALNAAAQKAGGAP